MNWEYKTLRLDVMGFMSPKVDTATIDAALNECGRDGWELISAFDTNFGHGQSCHIVVIFKRARSDASR